VGYLRHPLYCVRLFRDTPASGATHQYAGLFLFRIEREFEGDLTL
jgi:hypothetical protein